MLKIDEENCIKVKTTVQRPVGKTPHIYIPKVLEDQDQLLNELMGVELCLDKKNKIVYFKYGFGDQ